MREPAAKAPGGQAEGGRLIEMRFKRVAQGVAASRRKNLRPITRRFEFAAFRRPTMIN